MADQTGFLKHGRALPQRRPVDVRIRDWKEVYEEFPAEHLHDQAARCMDCGIPFCHNGCPLGNLIPEWNDLVWKDDWREASERLHATNNFPEFTGRLCPAPCEAACVLGINDDPVTIKQVEVEIVDRAWDEGWVVPVPPSYMLPRLFMASVLPALAPWVYQLKAANWSCVTPSPLKYISPSLFIAKELPVAAACS
jgi:glutamate synthase (NADPH/NADH) small chain